MNEAGSNPSPATPDPFGSLDELDCRGRRVFVRVDPFVAEAVERARRTEPAVAELPGGSAPGAPPGPAPAGAASPSAGPEGDTAPPASTIERLLQLEARVIVGTHFPASARAETGLDGVEALAGRLSELLGVEVLMPDECVGDAAVRVIHELRQGQICVLPDLLSARGGYEPKNDESFARALATSLDAYVFDAFAVSHLEYASTVRLPRLVPRRALGVECRRELNELGALFASSRGSVALVLGGRDFSAKVDTIAEWLPRTDRACVGGELAVTLLAALGQVPEEACPEPQRLARARSLVTRARDLGVQLSLPVDFLVQQPGDQAPLLKRPGDLRPGSRIIDIGPESLRLFAEALGKATRVLWWGPLGDVWHADGAASSRELARLCALPELRSVVIGADTRRFVSSLPPALSSGIDLISTGSAAARALLGGRRLPGVEAVRARR